MGKKVFKRLGFEDNGLFSRDVIRNFYENKYYNLYMNAYKWNGLDYKQVDYLMRKLWANGQIALYKHQETVGSTVYPNGMLSVVLFAPAEYDMYTFPKKVTLIQEMGKTVVPTTIQEVDKDVVIGYAMRNKKSVKSMVDFYIKKIVDCELVIKNSLIGQKTPWLIATTPESQMKMEELWDNIMSDNPRLFVDLEDVNMAKALVSGAPYVIDKLYNYKEALENELKEFLGFNNLGGQEKKEHLLTGEIQVNDEITKHNGDCFMDMLTEFCDRANSVLNANISVELNKPEEYNEIEGEMYDTEQEN